MPTSAAPLRDTRRALTLAPMHRLASVLTLAPLLALLLAPLACSDASHALAPTPTTAAHADDVFTALAARFGPHVRDPKLTVVRNRLARESFTPSHVWADTTLWTRSAGAERLLDVWGEGAPGVYHLHIGVVDTVAARSGDYRQLTRLARQRDNIFLWRVHDELALGAGSVEPLGNAVTALFSEAERTASADARQAFRVAFPRTTTALGALFTLDTLTLTPSANSGTAIAVSASMHPDGLDAPLPRYAAWLRRYVIPNHFEVVATDASGARWWTMAFTDARFTLDCRVRDGSLVPLDGAPRTIPDTLNLRVEAIAKAWVFHIGFRALQGEMVLRHPPTERGIEMRFHREPEWVFPPIVGRMLRTPLSRPFQGSGSTLTFAARNADGAFPMIVERDFDVPVQESDIMRWLGGFGSSAVSDFRRGAEEQADRYTGSLFLAIRDDLRELAGGR